MYNSLEEKICNDTHTYIVDYAHDSAVFPPDRNTEVLCTSISTTIKLD